MKILTTTVMAIAMTLPTGISVPGAHALSLTLSTPVKTQVTLNLNNPNALDIKSHDFTQDVVLPARAALAAQREAEAAGVANQLAKAGLKPAFAAQYLAAQKATGTPWQLIAAVHKIETGQAGDTHVASYAGAQGPMQFMPSTFRAYAVDGNGDGAYQIGNAADAIASGANLLAAGGAARGDYHSALFNYNHAEWYVTKVMVVANRLGLS